MGKILIAYYSHSANTKKLAKKIRNKIDGELFEIQPKEPYPINYNMVVSQAKKEIKEGYHPELKEEVLDIDKYDTIFVGTPNWWSSIAPPVATFLEKNAFSGKTVVPFCTHGGGGDGHIEADIKKLCKSARVLEVFSMYGGTSNEAELLAWLKNYKKEN